MNRKAINEMLKMPMITDGIPEPSIKGHTLDKIINDDGLMNALKNDVLGFKTQMDKLIQWHLMMRGLIT